MSVCGANHLELLQTGSFLDPLTVSKQTELSEALQVVRALVLRFTLWFTKCSLWHWDYTGEPISLIGFPSILKVPLPSRWKGCGRCGSIFLSKCSNNDNFYRWGYLQLKYGDKTGGASFIISLQNYTMFVKWKSVLFLAKLTHSQRWYQERSDPALPFYFKWKCRTTGVSTYRLRLALRYINMFSCRYGWKLSLFRW